MYAFPSLTTNPACLNGNEVSHSREGRCKVAADIVFDEEQVTHYHATVQCKIHIWLKFEVGMHVPSPSQEKTFSSNVK
jgi:hypothetical protein